MQHVLAVLGLLTLSSAFGPVSRRHTYARCDGVKVADEGR